MNIEKEAAERLLDMGIKVRVRAPLFLRLFGKKTIYMVVRQPCLGTLYRISSLYMGMNIDDGALAAIEDANIHQLVLLHSKTLACIVAQAILNGNLRGRLLGGILSRWLFWGINPVQLFTLANVLVNMTAIQGFTNTIGLVRHMTVTQPNPSHTAEGS